MKKKIVALLLATLFVVLVFASCGAKSALNETYVLDKVTVSLTKEGKQALKDNDLTKDDLVSSFEKVALQEITFSDKLYEADGSTLKGKITGLEYKCSGSKVTYTYEDSTYGTVKVVYKKK